MTLRFDRALPLLVEKVAAAHALLSPLGESMVIVRDVLGRMRVFIDRDDPVPDGEDYTQAAGTATALDSFVAECVADLGPFVVAQGLLFWRNGLVDARALFDAPDAWHPGETPPNLRILDRQVTGREWLLPPLEIDGAGCPKAVFFGLKGGVGRTTALALLARRLSEAGKKVLVVDLDLESPGLGPILIPWLHPGEGDTCVAGWPTYGVADWFVEDALGQADDELLSDMVITSPLSDRGEILVAPACGGLLDQDYIAKLSRVYVDLPTGSGQELFGDRLERLLRQLESSFAPDAVLLDSRAGMHDISSTTLMRLQAVCFLFAVDAPQTWEGYRHLFRHLQANPDRLREARQRLKTVAALTPTGLVEQTFLEDFCEHSSEVFSALYDGESDSVVGLADTFNFAEDDPDAPHFPSVIRMHPDFAMFQPLANSVQLESDKVNFAFGRFLDDAVDLLFPEDRP